MSGAVTMTPGVSKGGVLGGIDYLKPVTVAAGSIVPKGMWLATGTGITGTVFQATPPGGTAANAAFIISDGFTVTATAAATLYRYIFG